MLKPTTDHVIIEAIKEPKKKTAILLPDNAEKEKPGVGKVVAVNPFMLVNGQKATHDIKKGDTVFYKKYSEHKIQEGDREYIVVKFADILAIK